ncbi:hypothetical protein PIB30_045277, partial [Stylosanthes scabra]|nr:hypothetical protein [Stylosanthes scabra]
TVPEASPCTAAAMAMATAEHKANAASCEEEGAHDSAAGELDRRMSGGQETPRRRVLPLIAVSGYHGGCSSLESRRRTKPRRAAVAVAVE